MNSPLDTPREWHLDKRVPLTIIGLLVANIFATGWGAATLTADVQTLKARPYLAERVIRLEAITEEHSRYLTRLSLVMDRVSATMDVVAKEQARRAGAIEFIKQQTGRDE